MLKLIKLSNVKNIVAVFAVLKFRSFRTISLNAFVLIHYVRGKHITGKFLRLTPAVS